MGPHSLPPQEPIWKIGDGVPQLCAGCVQNTQKIAELEQEILLLRTWGLDFQKFLNDCWAEIHKLKK